MSVSTNQYIFIGVKLPYKNDTYELYEDYQDNGYKAEIKHHNGLAVIYDGMNGKYILVGSILLKSELNRELDVVYQFKELDPVLKEMLAALINTHFPGHDVEPVDIGTWFVTHYH